MSDDTPKKEEPSIASQFRPIDQKHARFVNMGRSNFISSMRIELKRQLIKARILPGERIGNEYNIDADVLRAINYGYINESLPAPKEMILNHRNENGSLDELSELREEVSVLKHNLKLANDLLRGAGKAISEAQAATRNSREDVKTKDDQLNALKADITDIMHNSGRKIVERALMKVLPAETNNNFSNGYRRY